MFEEFYQVDRSLHRRHGGAGLGLAISKRFVEAHDGRIWLESKEGVGSTFSFTLPIPGQHVPLSRLRVDRPLEPSSPELPPPILVVDPDPAVGDLIRHHMEAYQVVQVESVDQLAEKVMLHHPQAVVWNALPGEHDGHEGLILAPVPCIKCSLPSQAWVADDLAVAACLTKPITAKRLLREIERLGQVHDVLIIDDDRDFCQLVARMLEVTGQGFEVRRAYCGADGLLALHTQRPDLVLLDLVMPGADGFQVLEEMRREPGLASVPVIVLTATSFAEDALARHDGHVTIYRPGGLSPAEVLRCLRALAGVLEPRYDERSAPDA
jgi:CheY-like chemotaxis protein